MKTILYNPIFINPQAYYVFPNLNGQLVEQKDTAIEPAKYSGIIEVKVIANGDSKLIRYYSNTNKIDLSEFKDSWIRINLYTDLGAVVLGEWKLQISTPISPEVNYTVFPTIDLQEVPQDEIDKRNLVPRKSVNESETLMKCQHYTQLKNS